MHPCLSFKRLDALLGSPVTTSPQSHRSASELYSVHLLNLLRQLEPLHILLGLEDGLHVPVALQQAFAVKVPLFDMLFAPGINSLEQRLQLRLRNGKGRRGPPVLLQWWGYGKTRTQRARRLVGRRTSLGFTTTC